MGGDPHRRAIDIARQHRTVQPLCRGDRQDAAAGADVERPAEAAAPRQAVERHEAAAGRGMLAGAESRRRVDLNGDRAGRWFLAPMRAVHKKPPDPHRRKGPAVFRQPVALRQSLLDDVKEPAA